MCEAEHFLHCADEDGAGLTRHDGAVSDSSCDVNVGFAGGDDACCAELAGDVEGGHFGAGQD